MKQASSAKFKGALKKLSPSPRPVSLRDKIAEDLIIRYMEHGASSLKDE